MIDIRYPLTMNLKHGWRECQLQPITNLPSPPRQTFGLLCQVCEFTFEFGQLSAYHREVVPDGYDVNHKNGKNLAFPDAAHNVEILPSPVNRSRVLMGEF